MDECKIHQAGMVPYFNHLRIHYFCQRINHHPLTTTLHPWDHIYAHKFFHSVINFRTKHNGSFRVELQE